jgi:pantothenate kinase
MTNKQKTIIIAGANSIHTLRYIDGISKKIANIVFITNNIDNLILPKNVTAYAVNFKLTSLQSRYKIAQILKHYNNCIVHIQQANSYAYHTLKAIVKLY